LYVRFIRVDLVDTEGPEPVPAPKPTLTSETVERALEDAELMVAHGKPANAVDRVHTALHSYVKQVCSDAGFPTDSLTITAAIKLLRQQHPVFSKDSDRSNRSASIMKSFAAVCDSLNQDRNTASLAHPNIRLLGNAEAMLAINASRTILHYIHSKLQS
jgi:hypothetical protein